MTQAIDRNFCRSSPRFLQASRYTKRVKTPTPALSSLANRVAPERHSNAHETPDGTTDDAWVVHTRALEKARAGEAVIFLSIGQEADETTPSAIVETAVSSLQAGDHHYNEVEGTPEVRQAVADYHYRLTGQRVTAGQCLMYCGAQNGLFAVAQALLERGNEVVLSEPYYTTYPACFTASGATAKRVTLRAEDGYRLNVDRLLAAITPKTRAVVLNTPNNPMGECYTRIDLERILSACVERGVWLIMDMVYAELVDPEKLALPHGMPGANDVVISVGSVSKSHRMTGWRAGWVVAPQRVADTLRHLSTCMHYGIPPFIMKAVTQALNHDSETPKIIRTALAERRAIIHQHLAGRPGVQVIDSGQGMFVLLDVSHTSLTAKEFALSLLEKTGVSVLPCDGFGAAGRYLVRISLAVDSLNLVSACNAIAAFSVSLSAVSDQ
jgi:arginine:pyruvate transaminase